MVWQTCHVFLSSPKYSFNIFDQAISMYFIYMCTHELFSSIFTVIIYFYLASSHESVKWEAIYRELWVLLIADNKKFYRINMCMQMVRFYFPFCTCLASRADHFMLVQSTGKLCSLILKKKNFKNHQLILILTKKFHTSFFISVSPFGASHRHSFICVFIIRGSALHYQSCVLLKLSVKFTYFLIYFINGSNEKSFIFKLR